MYEDPTWVLINLVHFRCLSLLFVRKIEISNAGII